MRPTYRAYVTCTWCGERFRGSSSDVCPYCEAHGPDYLDDGPIFCAECGNGLKCNLGRDIYCKQWGAVGVDPDGYCWKAVPKCST